jgi:restriction system protein
VWKRIVAEQRERRKAKAKPELPDDDEHVVSDVPWKERLLDVLLAIDPKAFERLCQRLLRESGFIKVEITGRSGDGGIDGVGVLRLNLLSFHVLFQCKRWKSSVGASAVRDFRGAMVGRADKGLILTTGSFTADARREATRDGAPAIDLVDGDALCELLKSVKIGVSVTLIEQITIDEPALAAI